MAAANDWYVLTGGPGAGKTMVLTALAERGYHTVPEAARVHVEHGFALGKKIEEIRADEAAFQRELIRLKVAVEQAVPKTMPVFFDRGMHDSLTYLGLQGVHNDPELAIAVSNATYQKAFHLEMIALEDDGVRTETQAEAEQIHADLRSAYEQAGIPVEAVPVMPVEERVNFILERL